MSQFLIVYNRRSGLVDLREFAGDTASRDAMTERFRLEDPADPDLEVLVLSAENEAALRSTHGRFFRTFSEAAGAIGETVDHSTDDRQQI